MSFTASDPLFINGLEFGNIEQIKYLRAWSHLLESEDEKREQGLKLWKIDVTREVSYQIEVWSEYEMDAIKDAHKIEQLKDDFNYDCDYTTYEIMNVTEVP
jgi:hypothetical protein